MFHSCAHSSGSPAFSPELEGVPGRVGLGGRGEARWPLTPDGRWGSGHTKSTLQKPRQDGGHESALGTDRGQVGLALPAPRVSGTGKLGGQGEGLGPGAQLLLERPEPGRSSLPRLPGNRPTSQGPESLPEHRGFRGQTPTPHPRSQRLFLDLPLKLLHSHFFPASALQAGRAFPVMAGGPGLGQGLTAAEACKSAAPGTVRSSTSHVAPPLQTGRSS